MEEESVKQRPSAPVGPHIWQIRAVRDLLWLFGGVVLVWLLYLLRAIVLPIFIGLLLAYLANPLLTLAKEKWRVPFAVSLILIFATVFLLVTGAGIWLGPLVKTQTVALVENVPEYLQRLSDRYGFQLDDLAKQFKSPGTENGSPPVVQMARSILGTTTEIILWIVLVPVYFSFFAWHFQTILRKGRRYFLVDRYPRVQKTLQRMDQAVGTFFRARVLIALMVGIVYSCGWWLADVPYWFLLGAVTGLFSVVPYLSIAGWCLALLLKYLNMTIQGPGFEFMDVLFWPSVVFGIGNFLEAWIFTPWIHGRTTRLNPVMILTIVLIGGSLAGFWGLLLAIPVAICLNILIKEFIHLRVADQPGAAPSSPRRPRFFSARR
jgi:predicted PurR-regulated permease PerM